MERHDLTPKSMEVSLLGTEKTVAPKAPAGVQFGIDHGLGHHADKPNQSIVKPLIPTTGAPMHERNPGMRGEMDRAFFSFNDNALAKQIGATHVSESVYFEVRPILSIVESILHLAKPKGIAQTIQLPKDKLVDEGVYPEHKISWEVISKCAAGGESHSVTMDLLGSLARYSWDAKVVITFAAFTINYGEFWPVEPIWANLKPEGCLRLAEHFNTENSVGKNIPTLKYLPDMMANDVELKKKFNAVHDLLNSALKVAHCIIAFNQIIHESPETTAAMAAHIPTAVYWIIRSILACSFTLLSMIGSSVEYKLSPAWEILSLNRKVQVIMDHLQCQLRFCNHLRDRQKALVDYESFVKFMETSHIDNMKVLRAMIRSNIDERPLYDGTRRTNERLDVLRRKYVLLLISDLDIPQEELNLLYWIYNQQQDMMRNEYEVLWLPIIPSQSIETLQDDALYQELRNVMPWFSVEHPSLVEHAARRYIREVWKFVHFPMLVVLDPQGRPSNLDALPMMWIWGYAAFPFTKARESALWSESSWNIELLADAIDPRFIDWIRDDKVICLYGGEDIEWIRKFTHLARSVAVDLNVNLEMLYVGKRNPKDKVRRCHEIIVREKLSHVFSESDYYDYIWYFWVRVTSMWNSMIHIGLAAENDKIQKEIVDILTLDSDHQGWAVFSRGNHEITKANGEKLLVVLGTPRDWASLVDVPKKFVSVLDKQLGGENPEHHCNRLILPGLEAKNVPETVVCADCGRIMDKYVMFHCCTTD